MSILRKPVRVPLETWTNWGLGGRAYRGEEPALNPPPWDTDTNEVVPSPLPAHVGLWLDRYLVEPDIVQHRQEQGNTGRNESAQHKSDESTHAEAKPGRDALHRGAIEALNGRGTPARKLYDHVISRYRAIALAPSPRTRKRVVEVEAVSRILLHPATSTSVTEGSLLLHHTYGVPYLPGTALKGIARARARKLGRLYPAWFDEMFGVENARENDPSPSNNRGRNEEPFWVTELFGFVEEGEEGGLAGFVDFWDALWIPGAGPIGSGSPLGRDIVNPHHSSYYTNQGTLTPGESPVPTHFLTVRPGTRFLLVLEAINDPMSNTWLRFVLEELLLPALAHDGIGARTAAGYGRLRVVAPERKGSGEGRASPTRQQGATKRPDDTAGARPASLWRNKGSGELGATFDGGRTATVRGEDARRIFQSLPEPVRKKLDRGKSVVARVRTERVGRALRIVSVDV